MWRFLQTHKLMVTQSLIFLGLSLSFIVVNGLYRCIDKVCGLWIGLWHLHDSLWHLSLVSTAFKEYPFIHPEFAGANLAGYNYLLDLIIYGISLLGISPLLIFFQILPIFTALLFIYLVFKYAKFMSMNHIQSNAFAFFMYFGSSFSYLATLYTGNTLFYASMRGFPVVTSIQPAMMFLNIQFALSLCTILISMMLLNSKFSYLRALYLGILTFIAAGLKFYAGAMLISYIFLVEILKYIQFKNFKHILVIIMTSSFGLILAYLIFYRVPGSTSIPFAFSPLSLVHLMIEDPLLFYNHSLTLARYFLYENATGFSPRLWGIEILSITLFLMVNFGTRLFGLTHAVYNFVRRKLDRNELVLLVLVVLSAVIPILFVQDGGWYNTMQFLYYGVFFASFLTYKPFAYLFESRRKLFIILAIIWIALTIPNHFDQLRYFSEKQNVFTDSELSSFNYLKKLPKGVVYQSGRDKENAYITAFSGQQSYFVDLDQLMVTHVPYYDRHELFNNPSKILKDKLVQYVYINRSHANASAILSAIKQSKDFELVFENEVALIYQRIP